MTDRIPPMIFDWDGEAMVPRLPRLADRYFVVGEEYRLAPAEERSGASHRHFFAQIAEAHANLPEDLAERLPTPDHLRRWALIRTGFRDERSIVASSKEDAERIASFVKPLDDFAVVTVSGPVVTVYTAKSQSARAMGKQEFQASKERVLDFIASLIGVERGDLERNTGAAA